jgi:hypothetical protein
MWQWANQNAAAVQALGTVFALALALAIAWKGHRQSILEGRRRREEALESVSTIAAWAAAMIAEAEQNMADPDLRYRYFLGSYDAHLFAMAEAALERIPLHDLPQANLIAEILTLVQALGRVKRIMSQLSELSATAFPDELPSGTLGQLAEQRLSAAKASEEIQAAVFAYQ